MFGPRPAALMLLMACACEACGAPGPAPETESPTASPEANASGHEQAPDPPGEPERGVAAGVALDATLDRLPELAPPTAPFEHLQEWPLPCPDDDAIAAGDDRALYLVGAEFLVEVPLDGPPRRFRQPFGEPAAALGVGDQLIVAFDRQLVSFAPRDDFRVRWQTAARPVELRALDDARFVSVESSAAVVRRVADGAAGTRIADPRWLGATPSTPRGPARLFGRDGDALVVRDAEGEEQWRAPGNLAFAVPGAALTYPEPVDGASPEVTLRLADGRTLPVPMRLPIAGAWLDEQTLVAVENMGPADGFAELRVHALGLDGTLRWTTELRAREPSGMLQVHVTREVIAVSAPDVNRLWFLSRGGTLRRTEALERPLVVWRPSGRAPVFVGERAYARGMQPEPRWPFRVFGRVQCAGRAAPTGTVVWVQGEAVTVDGESRYDHRFVAGPKVLVEPSHFPGRRGQVCSLPAFELAPTGPASLRRDLTYTSAEPVVGGIEF